MYLTFDYITIEFYKEEKEVEYKKAIEKFRIIITPPTLWKASNSVLSFIVVKKNVSLP